MNLQASEGVCINPSRLAGRSAKFDCIAECKELHGIKLRSYNGHWLSSIVFSQA